MTCSGHAQRTPWTAYCRYEKIEFQRVVQSGFDQCQDSSWLVLDASKSIDELQLEVSLILYLAVCLHSLAEVQLCLLHPNHCNTSVPDYYTAYMVVYDLLWSKC